MVYGLLLKIFDKSHDFIFPIVNFPFICSNIPAAPVYGVYISQLIRYYRACGTYQDFLERGFVLTRKLLNQGFLLVQLKSHFERLAVATMTCFTLWNICVTTDDGYVPLVANTSLSFPHSWLITGFATRLTRLVWLMEQELLTHPEYMSSTPVFSGVRIIRSFALYVCFVDRCFSFYVFSVGHCVVCSSSI